MTLQSGELVRDDRQTFMAGEGFVLYNYVLEKAIRLISEAPLPKLEYCEYVISGSRVSRDLIKHKDGITSTAGLFSICKVLGEQASTLCGATQKRRRKIFDLSKHENFKAHKNTFTDGIDEIDFTWFFSGALAAASINRLIEAEVITKEEVNNFELPDWADIIGSDWFGRLTRTLAHTGFGVYGDYGKQLYDYRSGALGLRINKAAQAKYRLEEAQGSALDIVAAADGFRGQALRVSQPYNQLLFSMLGLSEKFDRIDDELPEDQRFGSSIGCPVARHATVLPTDYEKGSPRAVALASLGRLTISDTTDVNGNYIATQKVSGIERNLKFIADQLYQFHNTYGTPGK